MERTRLAFCEFVYLNNFILCLWGSSGLRTSSEVETDFTGLSRGLRGLPCSQPLPLTCVSTEPGRRPLAVDPRDLRSTSEQCRSLGCSLSHLTLRASFSPLYFHVGCPIVRPYVSCVLIFAFRKYVPYRRAPRSAPPTAGAEREIRIQSRS